MIICLTDTGSDEFANNEQSKCYPVSVDKSVDPMSFFQNPSVLLILSVCEPSEVIDKAHIAQISAVFKVRYVSAMVIER